jgi:hypothetical protein
MMFTKEAIHTESSDMFGVKRPSDMVDCFKWKAGQETIVRRFRYRMFRRPTRASFARRPVTTCLRSALISFTTAGASATVSESVAIYFSNSRPTLSAAEADRTSATYLVNDSGVAVIPHIHIEPVHSGLTNSPLWYEELRICTRSC